MREWSGLRILILGAARQGLALARYAAAQNAIVTLNDQRPASEIQSAIQSMSNLPVHWVFGSHPIDLLNDADLVCLSGGIPLNLPIVVEASRRGIPLTNDTQLFLEQVRAPVVGITGSAGKTTTTTLLSRIARAGLPSGSKVWTGGNIGQPLIEFVDQIREEDLVVLELSSFQLEQTSISPHVAAILNITPNHLDRHGTLAAYTGAKARILAFQHAGDIAILGCDDPGAWALACEAKGKLSGFGLTSLPSAIDGAYSHQGFLHLRIGSDDQKIMPESDILLRGAHNLRNTLAACSIAWAANLSIEAMQAGIQGFAGVPHRLEWVATINGVNWYNDSIATAPERSLAALRSFEEPLVLLLGGRDKNLPWETLAQAVRSRVDHVIVFGEAADKIAAALGKPAPGQKPNTLELCSNLKEAVQTAARTAEPGDVVLLSPGGTSYDEFRDFEERGERFREWVNQLI
ncbi:MAG: UDP-N-acetylmuramoyl-L-alanine--D-glutamate ligase [Anaerolineaceae bacterium]|nr:UDP-N-acetylmuramoyl-L-alanine--D-glutamate ligase [Anaerolineaceae bacterium]